MKNEETEYFTQAFYKGYRSACLKAEKSLRAYDDDLTKAGIKAVLAELRELELIEQDLTKDGWQQVQRDGSDYISAKFKASELVRELLSQK